MSRNSKFLSNRIKISVSLHGDVSAFYCCRRHKFAVKVLCAAPSIPLLLTLTYSATKHTESIVTFPLQQWLRVRTTVLLSTNIVCVIVIPLWCIKSNKEVHTARHSYNLYQSFVAQRSEHVASKKTEIKCSCNWRSVLSFLFFYILKRCLFSFSRYILCYTTSVLNV